MTTKNNTKESCRLCQAEGALFHEGPERVFYKCSRCSGIFLAKQLLPESEFEFSRYKLHQNNVEDAGYRKFVAPIVDAILKNAAPTRTMLDFGAGSKSVIAKLLLEKGYKMEEYDPFFQPHPALLEKKYDHIACCETIEHFHNPAKEFQLLKGLLNPKGKVYLMTDPFHSGIDFPNWYYKNDPTHVFFYSRETFEWIRKQFDFSVLTLNRRLVLLSL